MLQKFSCSLSLFFAVCSLIGATDFTENEPLNQNLPPPPPESLYDITSQTINGISVPLSGYYDRVLLIVNITTTGPLVKQIEALERLYKAYNEKGFSILAFPSNDFTWQKRMSSNDVLTVCYDTFHVTFPVFALCRITGSFKDPVYQFLTNHDVNPLYGEDVTWNFVKFLVSRDGKVLQRFASTVNPEDPKIKSAIEAALQLEKEPS